jgi:hypothetical protein
MSRPRRAGSPWRLLAHEWLPGTSHHVTNKVTFGGRTPDGEFSKTHLIEGTEFDELVVGHWIHIEQMTSSVFWMNISGVTINVRVDRDGRPRSVDVYGPDDYASAEPGVAYSLAWAHPDSYTAPGVAP